MNMELTLGSLFDGSGGFPLGGLLSGITPMWASEIEPFPIRVTTKRLPQMKHYGDISAINGGEIEPVDIITFGSPCTDMSVAGKRAGLDGHQSVLFYQAIRIIKEMRCKTNGKYPRYIVWENVPGAFSSNKGEDFKAVLEAVVSVIREGTEVPMPENGRWPYADQFVGDGWSIAYRVLDAQHFGVPQRRRRIYLVADFAGRGVGKILFESEGLSGYSAESFRSWQRTACRAEEGIGATGFDGYNGTVTGEVSSPLGVNCGMSTGSFPNTGEDVAPALLARDYKDATIVTEPSYGIGRDAFNQGKNAQFKPCIEEELSPTLVAKGPGAVAWNGDSVSPTLTANNAGGNQRMPDKGNFNSVVEPDYTVRRLTPTACARLQGFPDNWCADLGTEKPSDEEMYFWHKVFKTYSEVTNCKMKSDKQVAKWLKDPYSDSAEYKMWGNGVALPCVWFVLCGIVWYAQSGGDNAPI